MNKTMEKINYLDQYGRNNLTEKPLEYYLEAFEKTDPHKISSCLGIPYDPLRKEFTFAFWGQTFKEFVYTRKIESFAHIVGTYLRKQMEQD